ncbi:MAG: sensor histidine kinase [Thalassotalea sp.]|nr:sensor histidine kinase [Thalassotalea sp.]
MCSTLSASKRKDKQKINVEGTSDQMSNNVLGTLIIKVSEMSYTLLPLAAMTLLISHLHFLSQGLSGWINALSVLVMALITFFPMLVCHGVVSRLFISHKAAINVETNSALTKKSKWHRALVIWLAGFVIYPVLYFVFINEQNDAVSFTKDSLLNVTNCLLILASSCLWFLVELIGLKQKAPTLTFMSKLFSLNKMLFFILVAWSILISGVFAYVDDPLNNQPLEPVFDVNVILANWQSYLGYFIQFMVIGGLLFVIYLINRYLLIQQILTRFGVMSFLFAGLATIILITPILATIVLQLPMNVPNYTMIPSTDYNAFSPANYQLTFFVIFLSTPIILAFERQHQQARVIEISEQKTQTELKLLQQQINPHFLFNTLNNLYALTLRNDKQCPDVVLKLSDLLRYGVYEGQNKLVPFASEIAYLKNYIELQKIRWGNKCELEIEWPTNTENLLITPMLLIVLIENAIQYGIEPSIEKNTVQIQFSLKKAQGSYTSMTEEHNRYQLTLVCINPVVNKPDEASGVGLENLRKRLHILYPNSHSLMYSEKDNVWRAELSLTLEPAA